MVFELEGKTLGVVGCGRIGQRVLRIAHGFGMRLLTFDPSPQPALVDSLGVRYIALPELLERCDVVSLHLPLTADTHHLFDDSLFACMKSGAVLINTARGGLVDSQALARALDRGLVLAAGLDVLTDERELPDEVDTGCEPRDGVCGWRPPPKHVLLSHPRVLVTPHIGFNSREAVRRILDSTVANIAGWLRGSAQNRVA